MVFTVKGADMPYIGGPKKASGTVCVNDWTSAFWCRFHNLAARTSDLVDLDLHDSTKAVELDEAFME